MELLFLNNKKTLTRQLATIQMKGPIALRPYLSISLLLIGKSFAITDLLLFHPNHIGTTLGIRVFFTKLCP